MRSTPKPGSVTHTSTSGRRTTSQKMGGERSGAVNRQRSGLCQSTWPTKNGPMLSMYRDV
jgi:hypothetical protein